MPNTGVESKFRNMGPLNAKTAAQAASLVVKSRPGILFGFIVYNNNVAAQWIQIHDAVSLPANATVPSMVFEIAAQTARSIEFGQYGRTFAVGIVIANSTTDVTLTTGASDCLIDAQFV